MSRSLIYSVSLSTVELHRLESIKIEKKRDPRRLRDMSLFDWRFRTLHLLQIVYEHEIAKKDSRLGDGNT